MTGRKVRKSLATIMVAASLLVIAGGSMALAGHFVASPFAARALSSDARPTSWSAPRTTQDDSESWVPFDPAPPISLPTTSGVLTIVAEPGEPLESSYVFVANEPLSSVSASLWSGSPAWLLGLSPDDVHYVFMSYGETEDVVARDIGLMKDNVDAAINTLLDEETRAAWRARMHYVPVNPLALGTPVSALLRDWGAVFAQVDAEWVEGESVRNLSARATTDSGWARSLTETGPFSGTVGLYGNLACGASDPTSAITGTIALIERGVCPFTEKAANAERNGAIATIIFTTPDRELVSMGGSCEDCPDIPVVMIDNESGATISAMVGAGISVTATLSPDKGGIEMMAIDRYARVRQFGTIPWPWNGDLPTNEQVDPLRSIAYEAQHLRFEYTRDERLAAEEALDEVTIVPVVENEWVSDPGWAGVRTDIAVQLPDAEEMERYDTLELWLSLACQDHWRSNCPAWDYIVNLYLCDEGETDRCSIEFGRWITPYWAEGRWVVDVSPLLGLISGGGERHFEFYTQQRYNVDLSIRLSHRGKGFVPRQAVELPLHGGEFWNDYNKKFEPMGFQLPEWADKVEIFSVISGHGFGTDSANCSEFCNHTHHYTVTDGGGTDSAYALTHPEAGTLMGCAEQVVDGTVPNQAGTWIYGRGGWCPGLEVSPWVIDITDAVQHGVTNTLRYRGLYDGADFVPEKAPGQDPNAAYNARIDMRAFMVFSERVDVASPGVYLPMVLNAYER